MRLLNQNIISSLVTRAWEKLVSPELVLKYQNIWDNEETSQEQLQ